MKTRFAKLAFSKRQAASAFKKSGGDPLLYKVTETPKFWTFVLKSKGDEDDVAQTERVDTDEPDAPEKVKEEKPEETADDGSAKPAAQVLKSLHNHHKGLSDYADETQHSQDHPAILKMLMDHGEKAKSMMQECKDAAKEHYPDLDFDKFCKSESVPVPEDPDDDEDEDALDEFDEDTATDEEASPESEEDEAKKRLNGKVTKKYRMKSEHAGIVKDAHEFLDDMGGNEAVPKSLRGGCKFHAGELTKMLAGNGDTNREGQLEKPEVEDMEKSRDSAGQGANNGRENDAMWARMREDDDITGPDKKLMSSLKAATLMFTKSA